MGVQESERAFEPQPPHVPIWDRKGIRESDLGLPQRVHVRAFGSRILRMIANARHVTAPPVSELHWKSRDVEVMSQSQQRNV